MKCHPYEIRVVGILDASWAGWFDGLIVGYEEDGIDDQFYSILSGSMDQAALHGVLMRIRDLGLELISLSRSEEKVEGDIVNWLALFDQQQVRYVVLDRRADSALVEALRRRREWVVDFEDNESVIFTRRSE